MKLRAIVPATAVPMLCFLQFTPTAAQKVTFNPSVLLEQGYSDNVRYGGTGTGSDTSQRLQLELPYERESPSDRLAVFFRPSYVRQHDFDQLDRDEYRFDVRWDRKVSRQSRLRAVANLTRTQQQGTREATEDPELFLTHRVDRDLARADLAFSRTASPTWTWELDGGAATNRYERISGFEAEPDKRVEDRSQYTGSLRLSHSVSHDSSVGVRYGYSRFDLADSGDADSHDVAATYDKKLGQRLSLRALIGAARSSGTALEGRDAQTNLAAELGLNRTYERFRLELDVRHRPSSGGSLRGTATLTSARVELVSSGRGKRPWSWQIASTYGRRDPTSSGSTIESYGLRGRVERRLGDTVALRLNSSTYEQTNRDGVLEAGLAFVWYPWAATNLGQGR